MALLKEIFYLFWLKVLRRLEYRGYDSAGVAFKKNGSISVTKNLGRVNQLTKKLNFKN
ncbi:MAG: hypothetical protein CM15mP31_1470 [Gammaproteobacteria bacterium]|nr:MAG: hypothetical protein CM15mP31_1470 [Gammaproteobacteria bacterium]